MVRALLLATVLATACGDDADPATDLDAGVMDVDTAEPPDTVTVDTTPEDTACPPNTVPREVNGHVVDPCGCCRLDEAAGFTGGATPPDGHCWAETDFGPPCEHGTSAGCPYFRCTGSHWDLDAY